MDSFVRISFLTTIKSNNAAARFHFPRVDSDFTLEEQFVLTEQNFKLKQSRDNSVDWRMKNSEIYGPIELLL